MAGKFTFKLRVKEIDFNFQRSKGDVFTSGSDTDWLTLVVKYASSGDPTNITTASVNAYRLGDGIKSGDTRTTFDPPIELDNIVLTDDSTLLITAYIENRGHDDTLSKALAVVGTVIGALGLVVGGLGGLNKVAVAVAEGKWEVAIGGFIDGFDALATTLGLMAPNCDGPVFGPMNVPFVQDAKALLTAVGNRVNSPVTLATMTDSPTCPSECGHNPQTSLTLELTMTDAVPDVPSFGGVSPGPTTPPGPQTGGPVPRWTGAWVENRFEDASRIVCQLTASETQPDLAVDQLKSLGQAVSASGTLQAFGADRTKLGGVQTRSPSVSFPNFVSRGRPSEGFHLPPSQSSHLPHTSVDLTEYLERHLGTVAVDIHEGGFLAVPMMASDFKGNVFPSENAVASGALGGVGTQTVHFDPGLHFQLGTPSPPPSDKVEIAHGGGFLQTAVFVKATGPELCDTILLGNGVSLQLYAIWNDQRRMVDQRIRYTRVGAGGDVVTDAMLSRAETEIK
jgi:hypothetical protein